MARRQRFTTVGQAWWTFLALLAAGGCDTSERHLMASSSGYMQPAVLDAGVPSVSAQDAGQSATPLLPNWCSERDGGRSAAESIGIISDGYLALQLDRCGAMTRGMDREQLAGWQTYLYDYTYVMAGCVQLYMPPPGGILAFGPANTAVVGFSRGALSRSDAALLIELYVSSFAPVLSPAGGDQLLLEAHLWRTAEPAIDASLAGGLALCTSVPDEGG